MPFAFLLLLALIPVSLLAQVDTGGITGTLFDPTGALVPGATVTLANTGTNVSQSTVSTQTGTYSFSGIRPGAYRLTATATGFQTFVDKGIQIHVQQTVTEDVHFVNGAVSQQVTVTSAAPLLQAENAAVGQTIDTQQVNDLPLQTRNWASLAQLSAGVNTAPIGQPSGDSGSTSSAFYSVNGINLWQNDFRLNGINDNIEMYGGSSVGSNAAITPPPDAIQEFKLQSGNFNAEFGHSTGAVINAAIKTGTNHLHGDVWEYLRNEDLNANLWQNGAANKLKPEYRQNIFGATLGGPIFKDKTFFFVDYQGQRITVPAPATSTVPDVTLINSLNSGTANLEQLFHISSGTASDGLGRKFLRGTVFDPATTRLVKNGATDPISLVKNTSGKDVYVRDPFYNNGGNTSVAGIMDFTGDAAYLNMIPASRLDPNAIKLLGVYPAPNVANSPYTNNFTWNPKTTTDANSYDIRIDHTFNAKNSIFGVYDRSLISQSVAAGLPGLAVAESGGRNDSFPAYAFAVGYTRIFTPTLTNEMHVGMVHADKLQRSIYGNTFGIPAQFGIQGIPQVANNGGIPPTSINGFTHIGVGNFTPTLQYVYSIEGEDNVTKSFRNHLFKTGVQVVDIVGNISQPPQGRGDINFNGQYSDIPNISGSNNGIADMLLTPIPSSFGTAKGGVDYVGGMSSFSGSNIAATDDQRWYYGAYFQDDWKVTPALTLNLGLRWDYFSPYAEVRGRQANFVPNGGNGTPGIYYMSKKGCAVPRSASFDALLASSNITLKCVSSLTLGNAQKTNFAPRLGFAFRATPTFVVRGGYGIAYGALGNLGYGGTLGTNYPFVYVATFNSPDSQHPLLLPDGTPATMEHAFTTLSLSDPTINNGQGLNLYGRQYNFQTPYVQTVNLTVQDQFTNHDSIQLGYVASFGRHLDNLGYNNSPTQILTKGVNPQPYVPYPGFARNSTYETTNANSNYNSMQLTYERQLHDGLSVLANYTWSKCMSDQHTQASQNQQYRAEWLPGFGIARDYALCDTDATSLVHVSGSYDLPFGRGRQFMSGANRGIDAVLGGWNVNFIYTYQGGQPITVGCANNTTEFGCFSNVVPGVDLYASPRNYKSWLNKSAFVDPPAATAIGQTDYSPLGGIGQQVRGPGFNNLDSSIFKNFTFTETFRLQFRAEAFNTTNTPPLANPSTSLTSSNFGQITSTRFSAQSSRRLQLALKLFF